MRDMWGGVCVWLQKPYDIILIVKNLISGLAILVIGIIILVFIYNNFGTFFKRDKFINIFNINRGYKNNVSAVNNQQAKVRITSLRPGGHFLGSNYGFVSLVNEGNVPVNISGWKIEANKGSFYINQAVEIYDPLGLSLESDIILQPKDQVSIFTNSSANGKNFLINKCMGYLQNTIKFEPPLPNLCPAIDRGEIIELSGICQDYLLSFRNCRVPGPEDSVGNDFACAEKLKEINYRGCFEKHRSDPDFLTNQWYVWGSGAILDPYHDIVRLVNNEGFIVSDYIY